MSLNVNCFYMVTLPSTAHESWKYRKESEIINIMIEQLIMCI